MNGNFDPTGLLLLSAGFLAIAVPTWSLKRAVTKWRDTGRALDAAIVILDHVMKLALGCTAATAIFVAWSYLDHRFGGRWWKDDPVVADPWAEFKEMTPPSEPKQGGPWCDHQEVKTPDCVNYLKPSEPKQGGNVFDNAARGPMTVQVIGPDNTIHEFPYGTDHDVIRGALRKRYGRAPSSTGDSWWETAPIVEVQKQGDKPTKK